MGKDWKIEEEEYYVKFKIFNLKRSKRINPRTGEPFDFFLMEGLDWVNIIALTPNEEIVLVRQFRHGVNEHTLEIPGGCVETSESPEVSVIRELQEETGYVAKNVELLGRFYPNPAMQGMRCYTYLARDVVKVGAQKLDPGEDIEVIVMPLKDVFDLIRTGKINHSIVMAAFSLFQLKLRA